MGFLEFVIFLQLIINCFWLKNCTLESPDFGNALGPELVDSPLLVVEFPSAVGKITLGHQSCWVEEKKLLTACRKERRCWKRRRSPLKGRTVKAEVGRSDWGGL